MKRILLVFLVLLFFSGSTVFFIASEFHRHRMNDITKWMKDEAVVTVISIPVLEVPSLLNRINDHEICCRGKMYDVIREFMENGFLTIVCIRDRHEESLLTAMKCLSGSDSPRTMPTGPDIKMLPLNECVNTPVPCRSDFIFPRPGYSACNGYCHPPPHPPEPS